MDLTNLSQHLGDIAVSSIAIFALVLTLLRIWLVRIRNAGARAVSEVIEAALIAVVLVFLIMQPFLMKTFYIPSGSMLPTLVDDDHIVVNKLEYRMEPPHHDDIVVFVAPEQALEQAPDDDPPDDGPTNYIKRLIGLPGDVITAEHGYITVNGHEEEHSDIRNAFNLSDRDRQHVKIESNDVLLDDGTKWTTVTAAQIAQQFSVPGAPVTFHPGETLRNGKVLNEPFIAEDPGYDLKIWQGQSVIDDPDAGGIRIDGMEPTDAQLLAFRHAPPGPVPPHEVFVMGDNRNDSNDSTRWGPLEENRLVGRATVIFWPLDRMRVLK